MRFLSIVWKNLHRRKTRSALTAAGVAIGVGAGVAMCAISWGFERSFEDAYLARNTDAIVAKITRGSLLPGQFDEARAKDFSAMPGIGAVAPMLSDFFTIEGSDGVIIYGWEPGSFLWDHLVLREGSNPAKGETGSVAFLGGIAASLLMKKPGDSLRIKDRTFRVAGVFESSSLVENGAVIIPLPQLQALTGRPEKINFLNIRFDRTLSSQEFEALRTLIERKFRGLRFFRAGEVASNFAGVQASKAMSLVTAAIALVIGTLGITNTVLMSVQERSREIGLLVAVGWHRRRIVAMIVLESVLITLAGAGVGSLLGVGTVLVMQSMEFMRGRITADFGPGLILSAIAVAAGLGILGAAYPALRAASIRPRTALHGG